MAQLTPPRARERFKERLILSFGLLRKPLKLFCELCGKFIPSDMPWTCGYCDTDNHKTTRFSFLYKCQRCKQPAKSLQCPHCDQILFLDGSQNSSHPAHKILTAALSASDEEKHIELARQREERKAELEHKIVVTRLNADLVNLKTATRPQKKKSALETLEENFSEHDAHVMAVHKIVKREKEANAKKYADDPELRDLADESVKNWASKVAG